MNLRTIQDVFLIMWDMFETYSEPSHHWKLFFDITFSKTSAWKWIKIYTFFGLLRLYKGNYCPFQLRNEEFTVDAYGQGNGSNDFIALQGLETNDIESCKFWKKFRAEISWDMEKLMTCVEH